MKRFFCSVWCCLTLLTFAGCGGAVPEEAPPESTPTLTPEEQQHMETQIDDMRKMYKK
ncbi:MAG: hypothetical protein R3C19_16290 [Planctomycetaceae bacterium]